ncbi:hypothetical protein PV755_46295 [Streptomyces caniscabiei]|uniref:Uncharacterized protein n=1 Tax=Streptomyces caniscabiei TaxID=2746961 RepID=A0A927QK41_9ACTN|nr:hypothetical protein [Streptomyces caniscabiei]MBD9723494.1 hypothetical protein [Streptomyces caniscabiei]MDX3516216.1 hypothetical protein [Streptomyces caniscabiei]MDX3725276.1 hypothetical protein [Streptomyces caniscabiei]WEO27064.1 hypothetical protein IHE65_30055 [Streptomyces caniscabiei]
MTGAPAGRDPPLLDWSNPSHWSRTARQCRYCPGLTHLRDSKGKAAHKVCAEAALAQQAADLADAYHNEGHLG